MINPWFGFIAVVLYFVVLVGISYFRSRSATLDDYLIGSRNSTWWLITLGMVSDSLSGVTYVSVPGVVSTQQYSYLQIIFGHFFGYLTIALVLMPLYYRKNLVSIYSYLGERFGPVSQKTGSFFFVASRLFGSAARLYIAVLVLHQFFAGDTFSPVISFIGTMALIVLYTYKGGIKSLVWTDAYQSIFLVLGIIVLFAVIWNLVPAPLETVLKPQLFFWDPMAGNFILKQLVGGMFITISMNGLDQNIMQKNLSCKTLGEAQKNMITFGFVLVAVNLIFVSLGALVLEYYSANQMQAVASDQLLPNLVFNHLGNIPVLFFILGLTAATFSSADSVLPSLASSIEIDLFPDSMRKRIPVRLLHLIVAILLLIVIIGLYYAGTQSLINVILRYAGYTYGPLLGLFAIGILTKLKINEKWVPIAAIGSIVTTALLDQFSAQWFNGYKIGVELILVNGLIFAGLISLTGKKVQIAN